MNPRYPDHVRVGVIVIAATVVLAAVPVLAVTQLRRGEVAPTVALKDQHGAPVSTAELKGKTIVVVFGETYHEKTQQACSQLDAVLNDARLRGEPIVSMLIVAQELKAQDPALPRLPTIILRDADRRAFGDYRVAVMPSVVVIDKEGRVVHATAGLTPRFSDLLTDSLLLATEKLSAKQFEASLHPSATTRPAEDEVRADRVVLLARQLARRGLDEMAAEKLREALQLDAHHAPAHLELGTLMLKNRRLAEAESHFRAVLADQPQSMQASLGLAFVQTLRGGSELDLAEQTVRDLLARNPSQPRAHYLLGLINQQRGKHADAASDFKRAAELLLERTDVE